MMMMMMMIQLIMCISTAPQGPLYISRNLLDMIPRMHITHILMFFSSFDQNSYPGICNKSGGDPP